MTGYTADIIHQKGIIETDLDCVLEPSTLIALLEKVRDALYMK